jgi:hypothetical protein
MDQDGDFGFLFGQEDLRARSRTPPLVAREHYSGNHVYAAGEILREYAGLPAGVPLPWAVQTVINFKELAGAENKQPRIEQFSTQVRQSGLSSCLTIEKGVDDQLRNAGLPDTHPIGSVFLYARELYRRAGLDTQVERRGTIALPDKSDRGQAPRL